MTRASIESEVKEMDFGLYLDYVEVTIHFAHFIRSCRFALKTRCRRNGWNLESEATRANEMSEVRRLPSWERKETNLDREAGRASGTSEVN